MAASIVQYLTNFVFVVQIISARRFHSPIMKGTPNGGDSRRGAIKLDSSRQEMWRGKCEGVGAEGRRSKQAVAKCGRAGTKGKTGKKSEVPRMTERKVERGRCSGGENALHGKAKEAVKVVGGATRRDTT